MEDGAELFTWHVPGHNLVGCDGVASEIDVISADINLGSPKNRLMFFEHFRNAEHFFVNRKVFQL